MIPVQTSSARLKPPPVVLTTGQSMLSTSSATVFQAGFQGQQAVQQDFTGTPTQPSSAPAVAGPFRISPRQSCRIPSLSCFMAATWPGAMKILRGRFMSTLLPIFPIPVCTDNTIPDAEAATTAGASTLTGTPADATSVQTLFTAEASAAVDGAGKRTLFLIGAMVQMDRRPLGRHAPLSRWTIKASHME